MKKLLTFVGLVVATVFISSFVLAETVGPTAHLTEQVEAHYDHEGNIDDAVTWGQCGDENPCRYGYSEVAVSNTQDVLQYIRVNVSDTESNNLVSETAFKGALASPEDGWDRSQLYFETTQSEEDLYYIIDETDAPAIQLQLDYENIEGGHDLYSAENVDTSVNTMDFTLTATNPSTGHDLTGVEIVAQFATEEGSVIDITDSGEATAEDTNEDGHNDRLVWTGDLTDGTSEDITFQGDMEEYEHFDGDYVDLDEDDEGARSYWEDEGETLSGNEITGKFSRGPMRQGTDLSEQDGDWSVRGFMKNLAEELTYSVDRWALYEVDDGGGLITPPVQENEDGFVEDVTGEDGRIRTTDEIAGDYEWYDTDAEKPYYATEMDWEVVWNDTNPENHYAYINTTMDMPRLHKVDMINEKMLDGILNPNTGGEYINVTDNTTHQGSPEAKAEYVEMVSTVPGVTTDGESPNDKDLENTFFEIEEDSVEVWFDGTEEDDSIDITDDADVDTVISQPQMDGTDGEVVVTIDNFVDVEGIDSNLNQSEQLRLEYNTYTTYETESGDAFDFSGENTYETESGTPLTEEQPTETISVSAKRLIGFKDLVAEDPDEPTVIDGTLRVEVIDQEGGGIEGILFTDYVPEGTDFDEGDVTVEFYDGDSWTEWGDADYHIENLGTVELPSGVEVQAYEYLDEEGGDGWTLEHEEMIRVSYDFEIDDSGLYEMPATLAGIDPATGVELGSTAIGDVRVQVPDEMEDMEVREGDIGLTRRASVGDMAEWMRPVEVYNPNTRTTEGSFEVEVLSSVEKAWVQYTDQEGETVRIDGDLSKGEESMVLSWEEEVPALSTRNYEVRAMTAPVMEVDRDVEVVDELPGEMVEIEMDVFVRNFAEDPYEEVVFDLPIPVENVISVETGFGEEVEYTGGDATTSLIIDDIGPDELRQVTIRYEQSYPTVIVTPEKDSYDLDSPVNISVLVINGGREIENARLESEIIGPGRNVVLSEIENLEGLEPLQETELTEEYVLSPELPSGDYMAHVRFREDFTTLASGTGNFYVEGAFDPVGGPWTTLILIIAVAGAGYLSYKRLGSMRSER